MTQRSYHVFHLVQPIKKYPEWTSSQGLNLVTRSRKWYCIGFWAILTLAFFAVMVWQCVLLIINYYSYPYSVQISVCIRNPLLEYV